MVIGCAAVDITAQARSPQAAYQSSTVPGTVRLSSGGVAHNIALAAQRSCPEEPGVVLLLAPVPSNDILGTFLSHQLEKVGLDTTGLVHMGNVSPATCNLVLDGHGDLITGVADMEAVECTLTPDTLTRALEQHGKNQIPRIVAMDANISAPALRAVLDLCQRYGWTTVFEPTSISKSRRIVDAALLHKVSTSVDLITPNHLELAEMASALMLYQPDTRTNRVREVLIQQLAFLGEAAPSLVDNALRVSHIAHTQMIKLGPRGVLLVKRTGSEEGLEARHISAPALDSKLPVHSTGAGDTFTGAVLAAARIDHPSTPLRELTLPNLEYLVQKGQSAAALTLASPEAVAPVLK